MTQQAFISYSSSDKSIADAVCEALEKAGVPCWIAPRNIEPGTDFPIAIVDAVNSTRVLVLILTDHAANSPHVLSEVGHAFNGKKRIIPFRISQQALPEDLEYFLSLTQWLDAPDGCSERNLKQLVDATLAAVAGQPVPRTTRSRKRNVLWIASGVLVLAVVVGSALYSRFRRSSSPRSSSNAPNVTVAPAITPPSIAQPKIWRNPADGENYVWIPPGTFMMGCSEQDSECKDDEKPAHRVAIEKGFWLGQTEVIVAAYAKFAAKLGRRPPTEQDGELPASGVSWAEAKGYCAAMGGRLPTEAEWEYAARGGKPQPFYGAISQIAWYAGNSGDSLHAVGKKQPNAFGLYDMLGNAAEWVLDRYFDKYSFDSVATGPDVEQPLPSNAFAVARGGFWESEAVNLRVSHRIPQYKEGDQIPIGFRCASDHP